jgi:formylglycine-generating enzyme required for sulfatase activity
LTDATTITCPECGSAQRADAPFCDNCGFRLGRPADAVPGLADTEVERPAVKPSELSGFEPGRPVKRAQEPAEGARSELAETEVEGFDAITPEVAAAGLEETTFNEGVGKIGSDVPTERGHQPVAANELDSGPYSSGMYTLESESRSRTVLWGFAWLVSLVSVAMGVGYWVRSEAPTNQPGRELTAVQPSIVEVPAGSFQRGLDESTRAFILRTCLKAADDSSECDQERLLGGEYPQEDVTLSAYEIDRTEVTVGQWEKCVAAGECEPIAFKSCKVYTHQGLQISLRVPKSLTEPEVAATCVSRPEAAAFCAWKGGRLPTHDQWERAARGTKGRLFPWGASWDPESANWGEADVARVPVVGKIDGFAWAAPPGQYPGGESPEGLYDVAGNVAEWVAGDPVAARGGSWASNPFDLRTTGRLALEPDVRRTDVGFRCAYDR